MRAWFQRARTKGIGGQNFLNAAKQPILLRGRIEKSTRLHRITVRSMTERATKASYYKRTDLDMNLVCLSDRDQICGILNEIE